MTTVGNPAAPRVGDRTHATSLDAYSQDMATWDDVRRIALALPETTERESRGCAQWRVGDKGFVWERPLTGRDLTALGTSAPTGPVLAARVPDLGAKEALIADDENVYFTTPHFNGYPVVLVRLDRIPAAELKELIVEAWLDRAPKRLATEYLRPA
ncbi:MmcQ/YjbR family DNA-binding protein [Rugosimonospora acidiphila]|uniref:MmcQ/YjbR family DNA-binding protein n=1 Tax=Rugosimonospora acidiphila TaxID=556531 RepID=A0ABP9RSQ0_9ACTN